MTEPTDVARRALMQAAAAGFAAGALPFDAPAAQPAGTTAIAKAGEFDFLAGQWKIAHRRLKTEGGKETWDLFSGEATCWTILGGAGSIEELRIPARNFSGLGIRLLDAKQKVWGDYWVNVREGVIGLPTTGVFVGGVGTFISEDAEGKEAVQARGVWDRITANSCRWHQATSRDGGKTWKESWLMDWVRA